MNEDDADRLRLEKALTAARDTARLLIGRGVLRETGNLFASLFPDQPAVVVADETTYAIAGGRVEQALADAGLRPQPAVVFPSAELYAESSFVDRAQAGIRQADAIPVAVGAGTVNDIVKLAAHRAGRRYLCVATAASMDGYTAYGSSITHLGSKQTFDCPAPLGVVADVDVIAAAPPWLNASGYADLFAKCPAGADWLLAEGVGVESVDTSVWGMVQDRLRDWLADPQGVQQGDPPSIQRLTVALMMTGFAMQAALSSRPASGAEHQFSHLWDMEKLTHLGAAPSHGFQVGIGSLASLRLYEALLAHPLERLEMDSAVQTWPDWPQQEATVRGLFDDQALVDKALEETRAKHVSREQLRQELVRLVGVWGPLRDRLAQQVYPVDEARDMLAAAGCPVEPEQIGISPERLRSSHLQAYCLRRRYTVLDLVRRAGRWDELIGETERLSRGR